MGNGNRAEKVVHSMAWIGVYTVVSTFMPFVTRTFLIHRWGLEYAGLSSLFSSIISILQLGEMGIGEAIIFNMYKPAAERNICRVNALLLLYKKIYFFIGILVLAVGICLIPFLPYLISGSYPDNINLIVLYLIYLLQVSGNYFFWAYYMSIFRTHQSLYITYKWRACIFLIMYTLQIGAIIFTNNYYQFVIWFPICTILANFIDFRLAKKYYPEYKPSGNLEEGFISNLLKRVVGMALRKLRNVVRGALDSVVISGFLGLVVLAKYQNYILLMTVPTLFFSVFNSGILQSLGNSNVLETKESNFVVIRLYAFITQWLGLWFSALLVNLMNPFMKIWAGANASFEIDIEVLLVIFFYLKLLTQISEMIRNSTGLWSDGKWIPIVESIANLALNLLFVQIWGIRGIIVATIITLSCINIPFETQLVFREYFNKTPFRELIDYLFNAIVAVASIFISYKVCMAYNGGIVSTFVVRILVSTFIPNIIFIVIHIRDERLMGVVESVLRVVRK